MFGRLKKAWEVIKSFFVRKSMIPETSQRDIEFKRLLDYEISKAQRRFTPNNRHQVVSAGMWRAHDDNRLPPEHTNTKFYC